MTRKRSASLSILLLGEIMDWPDFKMYDIVFYTRADFDKAYSMNPCTVDVGHSDRALRFDTAENAEEWARTFELLGLQFSRNYST